MAAMLNVAAMPSSVTVHPVATTSLKVGACQGKTSVLLGERITRANSKSTVPILAAGMVAAACGRRKLRATAGGVHANSGRVQQNVRGASTSRRAMVLAGEELMTSEETWTGLTPGKDYRLQVQCQEVAENTRTIRSLDWQRDRFDIEFALTHGTTYNAYTIKGTEKTALIDSSHKKFKGQFMEVLESPSGGNVDLASLDYLIVSHTEPDHSGLIEHIVLEAKARGNDKLVVVGSKVCITFLKGLVHSPFKSQAVKGGDQLDLGGGHVLDFVVAPNLHWPDTMFTYDNKTKLLYTCDAFGMHYCSSNISDVESIEHLTPHFQLYYDCLMKPNARSVNSAIKKMKELPGPVEAIMTGHGPVLNKNKDHWVSEYKQWSTDALKNLGPSMCIFWVSRHGTSEDRAQAFALGATSTDTLVEMQDLNAADAFDIVEAIHRNQIIVVFAPPKGQEGAVAQQALGSVIAACAPKENRFIVCSSESPDEEPVGAIIDRFKQIGIPQAMPPVCIQPGVTSTKAKLDIFEAAARDFCKKIGEKSKVDKASEAMMDALGKVSSGRYIITGMKDGASTACTGTWVMPSSKDPPMLSIALPKDSIMMSFLEKEDVFVVNYLAEGAFADIQKHFQQELSPDVVFEGVDTTTVEVPGGQGVVLRGCSGHVTCKVGTKQEVADHFIITGRVIEGELVKDVPVAVNHRKSGSYY